MGASYVKQWSARISFKHIVGTRNSVSERDHNANVDEFIGLFQGTRLLTNFFSSKVDTLVQGYNNVFDKLLRDFRDRATGDTLVVVHRIWKDLAPKLDDLRKSFFKDLLSNPADLKCR